MRLGDVEPGIFLELLETKGNPFVFGVDIQDLDVDLVTFLDDFRGMLDPLGPRHIRDMNQAVDTGLDFHKRPEGRQVTNLPGNARPHGILHRQHHPRILLRLLHPKGNLLFSRIHLQHDRFDRLPDGHHLRRMPDVPCPAHFADVHESLDTGLELHKRTVVGDTDYLPLNSDADRILFRDVLPRVGLQLFEP